MIPQNNHQLIFDIFKTFSRKAGQNMLGYSCKRKVFKGEFDTEKIKVGGSGTRWIAQRIYGGKGGIIF